MMSILITVNAKENEKERDELLTKETKLYCYIGGECEEETRE
jgi:hypothetical protein